MAAAGVSRLFPLGEFAIIGLWRRHNELAENVRRIRETADAVVAARPDVLVIIDSPEFTHRVARRVRGSRSGQSELSITSARRCGPGGRVARAP